MVLNCSQVCKDKEKEKEKEKENDKDKSGSEDEEPLSAKKKKQAKPNLTMAGTPRLRNNYFCGNCDGCQRKEDCGECKFCRDKPKFGGPNRLKKKCEERVCINKTPVVTDPKTKKLVQKCLGMKCTNQIPIKTRSKKPKRNPDDSDFRDGVEFGLGPYSRQI